FLRRSHDYITLSLSQPPFFLKILRRLKPIIIIINLAFDIADESCETSKAIRSSKGMWIFLPDGRFGNCMGQYATLFALARLNKRQAYILPSMANILSQIFKLTLPTINEEVQKKINWKVFKINDWMEEKYYDIPGDYVQLNGYPCSWTFYHHIRSEILREFTFHDFITEETNLYLRQITASHPSVTYIGVHIRRGDYVEIMTEYWNGVIGDKNYLEKAMSYFRNKYQDAVFLVLSNGMDWCKENIDASKGDVYFAGTSNESNPTKDFAILAHCNHSIVTIGTFGYWAAYLVGGETIYLTNFTLPDSNFLKIFRYEAAFLPEWIGIPADLSPLLSKSP
uniref:L-Fucosyltransferase n=1 Tax=Callorhinchus milii TaxID=7868 RepID=A0A4W3IV38_CALMI